MSGSNTMSIRCGTTCGGAGEGEGTGDGEGDGDNAPLGRVGARESQAPQTAITSIKRTPNLVRPGPRMKSLTLKV
jgi:hypothetical protein